MSSHTDEFWLNETDLSVDDYIYIYIYIYIYASVYTYVCVWLWNYIPYQWKAGKHFYEIFRADNKYIDNIMNLVKRISGPFCLRRYIFKENFI